MKHRTTGALVAATAALAATASVLGSTTATAATEDSAPTYQQFEDDGLVVNTVSGRDDKWSQAQVGNLTYCVSTKFGADYTRTVQAMGDGAAPRARAQPGLPPRAHAARVRHLLRGRQLASADRLRLGLDHALPPVQRLLRRPEHDRHRPPGRRRALRRVKSRS